MCEARGSCTLGLSFSHSQERQMPVFLSHSYLVLQLLFAAEDLQTKFFEAITTENLPAVQAFLKKKPELARANTSRGASALQRAPYIKANKGPTQLIPT